MTSFHEDLESYLKKNGFVWGPEPEIYDQLAGFHTYGPLGKLLKNKVERQMRNEFKKHQFYEVQAPIIMPRKVWKASGHLDTFVDPMVLCSECEGSYRADKLIEENFDVVADGFSDEELLEFIDENDINCPTCGGSFEQEIHDYNLMMKTQVAGRESYSRPETATTTYLPFKRYWHHFRNQFPIKVFQIGRAFRNEISPRKSIIRGREFTQAEGQIFLPGEEKDEWDLREEVKNTEIKMWSAEEQLNDIEASKISLKEALDRDIVSSSGYAWCLYVAYKLFRSVGIPDERIRYRAHTEEEKAHYAKDAWDLEINLNTFGWTECCGVHDRTDYDLSQHDQHSSEDLTVTVDGEEVTPHILEIAFGTDRPTYALLDIFYKAEENELEIPSWVAPTDAAVFPLIDKDGLPEIAEEIFRDLQGVFDLEYYENGSIGKRYARQDEKGTPLCVTVDHQTKEDDTVTVRERETTEQIRVKKEKLEEVIDEYNKEKTELKELGEPVE